MRADVCRVLTPLPGKGFAFRERAGVALKGFQEQFKLCKVAE